VVRSPFAGFDRSSVELVRLPADLAGQRQAVAGHEASLNNG
jgi:hypothetical protein